MAVNPSDAPPGRIIPYSAADQRLWDEMIVRPCVVVPFTIAHVTKVLAEGPVILVAIFARETGSAAGTFDLYNGRDSTGELAGSGAIASGGSVALGPHLPGVLLRRGLTMVVGASTLQGAAWVIV